MKYRILVSLVASVLVVAAAAHLGAQAAKPAGTVTITYRLTRIGKMAANQFAIWMEDEKGAFVKTLFVTGFAGRRAGWKNRPQTCALWVEAADVKNTPQSEIDAVSGSTPRDGKLTVIWDLTDRLGARVPPGTYRYRIEGNLYWENTVLWTGTIRVGGSRESSDAVAAYTPEGAEKQGTLIAEVSAVYEPAP